MNIEKKDYLDNTIIKELRDKYPKIYADNGVNYKITMEYVTYETDFITSAVIRKLIKNFGCEVLVIIQHLRTLMCTSEGWALKIDNVLIDIDDILEDCAYYFKLDEDKVKNIYSELIKNKVLYEVEDKSICDCVYLTCTQQIYNWEMCNNKRQKEASRKAEYRKKQQEKLEQSEQDNKQQIQEKTETVETVEEQSLLDLIPTSNLDDKIKDGITLEEYTNQKNNSDNEINFNGEIFFDNEEDDENIYF